MKYPLSAYIHFYRGKYSRKYRLRYHKRTGGMYMWGLIRFIIDTRNEN